jgi:glycosyltransferase involved in cell wall biosynthesis
MNLRVPAISVSVVIPCFRCATTIERAVVSVVQQTMKPAELILVDDNSNGTLAILQCYAKVWF